MSNVNASLKFSHDTLYTVGGLVVAVLVAVALFVACTKLVELG